MYYADFCNEYSLKFPKDTANNKVFMEIKILIFLEKHFTYCSNKPE